MFTLKTSFLGPQSYYALFVGGASTLIIYRSTNFYCFAYLRV